MSLPNTCYNCEAERDGNSFFYLLLIKRYDIAEAVMTVDPSELLKCDSWITVECCPNCGAEQT